MEDQPRNLWRAAGLVALALAITAAHFATYEISTVPVSTDTRYYVNFSWRVAEGAVPHRDFFDNKTQLASFVGGFFFRIGTLLRADPLMAIRVGYLGIAACAGPLIFLVHRHLFGGKAVQGFLAVLAWCSFGFIGTLIAVGPVPKLLMFLAALASALLAYRHRWFSAGVVGALAFMDWQIGALVWVAAFLTAVLFERPRTRALVRLVLGGLVGIAPFVAYYVLNGALRVAYEQTVLASFSRGSEQLTNTGVLDRLDHISKLVELYFPGRQWLFLLAGIGFGCAAFTLWRKRAEDTGRLLFPLFVYHTGVLMFSALDFQWQGDFMLLLLSLSFFLALTWNALFDLLDRRLISTALGWRRVVIAAVFVTIVIAASRPSFLRPGIPLYVMHWTENTSVEDIRKTARVTLQDQKDVAAGLTKLSRGKVLVNLKRSELAFLMRHVGPITAIYWNHAAYSHFRTSESESMAETTMRLLEELDPDVLVYPHTNVELTPFLKDYTLKIISSNRSRCRVQVYVR